MKKTASRTPAHDPGCQDDHDPYSLRIEDAAECIMSEVKPVTDTETLPLREALGRVLARAVRSRNGRARTHQLGNGRLCAAPV